MDARARASAGSSRAHSSCEASTHDELLRWMQFCVTGINHPVQLPTNPMYFDALIGGQEMWTGVVPKVGRQFIQTVAIEGFPLESTIAASWRKAITPASSSSWTRIAPALKRLHVR